MRNKRRKYMILPFVGLRHFPPNSQPVYRWPYWSRKFGDAEDGNKAVSHQDKETTASTFTKDLKNTLRNSDSNQGVQKQKKKTFHLLSRGYPKRNSHLIKTSAKLGTPYKLIQKLYDTTWTMNNRQLQVYNDVPSSDNFQWNLLKCFSNLTLTWMSDGWRCGKVKQNQLTIAWCAALDHQENSIVYARFGHFSTFSEQTAEDAPTLYIDVIHFLWPPMIMGQLSSLYTQLCVLYGNYLYLSNYIVKNRKR